MRNKTILGLVSLIMAFASQDAQSKGCGPFWVSAPDGYANVRSSPRVRADNILAAVPTGASIQIISQSQGKWVHIDSPVAGWVATSQIKQGSCPSTGAYDSGDAAIQHFARQGAAGDRRSASVFAKMSKAVDGALAETYAEEITKFAGLNPTGLLAILNAESSDVRQTALRLLSFGFGNGNSQECRNFNEALQKLPASESVLRDWHKITKRDGICNP